MENKLKCSWQLLVNKYENVNHCPGANIFICISKRSINKLAHIINGNRRLRGHGITCLYWNKGSSLLSNKQDEIKQIIQEHKPHIMGLGEANFKYGHDLQDVKIQGYTLHLDSAVDCPQLENTARVVVYTHDLVRVKRRPDLELDNVAAVWLECGLPQQKSTLYCMAYRQWRLSGQPDQKSEQQYARWESFLGKWEEALLEGKKGGCHA